MLILQILFACLPHHDLCSVDNIHPLWGSCHRWEAVVGGHNGWAELLAHKPQFSTIVRHLSIRNLYLCFLTGTALLCLERSWKALGEESPKNVGQEGHRHI